jgi:hypothetical protein
MEFIYVLELQGGKYYVGKTTRTVQERFEEHRAGKGSAWTRSHKPIRVVEQFVRSGDYDEDNTTKTYMRTRGIDSVRGGSYCNVHLSSGQVALLTKEFRGADDTCNLCGEPNHFARECPNNISTCRGVTMEGRPCKRTKHLNRDGYCSSHKHQKEQEDEEVQSAWCQPIPPPQAAAYGRTSNKNTRAGKCLGVTASGSSCQRTLYLNQAGFCPSHQDQEESCEIM